MKILSIETSCDETAAAIVSKDPKKDYVKVLSNTVASSIFLHSKTGGIIPETAAREQLKYITPVIKQTLENAFLTRPSGERSGSRIKNGFWTSQNDIIQDIDAIAVTMGPGLIGSLLVGVETAKTLAYLWKKPIIPVNHLLGHIYANWLTANDQRLKTIKFPAIALLVSGGHTDLVLLESHKKIRWLGGTLDDAAGEAFDKIGRLLNLPYPGGPAIEKASERGDINRFTFPSPMIFSKDFNFSFSGLKAAVWRETKTIQQFNNKTIANISASVQKSIIEVLVRKTVKAAKKYNAKSILLGGGVASNQKLREELELKIKNSKLKIPLFVPEKRLCTDNAAMIGAYAAFHPKKMPWRKITANPELYF